MISAAKPAAVFTTPPVTLEERYGSLAASGNTTPCLASVLLAAIARQAGYPVGVVDAGAEGLTIEQTLDRIANFSPNFLALTSTTLTAISAECLARAAKARWPDLIIGIGGPHVTAVPEETLRRCPEFDLVAIGEGDRTILDILNALDNGVRDFTTIPGLACRSPEGEIIHTVRREPFVDLDSLPFPAWDLLDGFPQRYTPGYFKVAQIPSASFVSSRGCPFDCVFCDTGVFGRTVRSHSPEYLLELFADLNQRFGIRDVTLEDDTFMLVRENVDRFCESLCQRGLKMTWACNSRVNLAQPDLLQTMKKAGCWHISYGVESGSQEILGHSSKRITLDQIDTAVRLTRQAGIAAKGFFIVGHPHETNETLQSTLRLALETPFSDISVTMMTPFPGSPLSKNAREFGTFESDWTRMNLLTPVFVPHGLTTDDLHHWQRKILRSFYFRPRTVFDYTKRILKNPSPRYIKGLLQSAAALAKTVFTRRRSGSTHTAGANL